MLTQFQPLFLAFYKAISALLNSSSSFTFSLSNVTLAPILKVMGDQLHQLRLQIIFLIANLRLAQVELNSIFVKTLAKKTIQCPLFAQSHP